MVSENLKQDQHVDSKDFRVHSINLIGASGVSQDITSMVLEVQIRQDMYLGFMSGEIIVTDAIDIHSTMGLHGSEYLHIHITEPQKSISFNKAFRIYKVGNRMPIQSGSSQRYIIYFTSDEMLISNSMKINKAYKDSTISSVVVDILVSFLKVPTNRLIVDPTSEPVSLIIPRLRPVEAINWLASRAFNRDQVCWFFYENLDGFNFRSVQAMYADPPVFQNVYTLENKSGEKDIQADKYSIDDYESKRDFDALMQSSSGGYSMALTTLDMVTQKYEKNEYGLDSLPTMFQNPNMSNPKNLFAKTDSHNLTYLNTMNISSWIRRVMSLSALNSAITEITVPGNVHLQAGRTVNIRVPYSTIPSESSMWDTRKSGKYLILAVNHKFDLLNHRYTSILLLGRDSVPEPLPAYDPKLPDKIAKLNSNSNRD